MNVFDEKKKELLKKNTKENSPSDKTKTQGKIPAQSESQIPFHASVSIQRAASEDEDKKAPTEMTQSGQPLDAAAKEHMESAFGEDLAEVQIHTDEKTQKRADDLGARAFTHERDIYFGKDEYNPSTQSGKELLAHELSHVIQQKKSQTSEHTGLVSGSGESLERQAEGAAHDILSGRQPRLTNHTVTDSIQKQEKQKKPSIASHGKIITSTPPSGTIDASGKFSVAYSYNIVAGADYVPLNLGVTAGVSVGVTPLSALGSGDFSVNDPGGSGARVVTISVSAHYKKGPKVQVTFTKESFTYIVVFEFPKGSSSTKSTESETPTEE